MNIKSIVARAVKSQNSPAFTALSSLAAIMGSLAYPPRVDDLADPFDVDMELLRTLEMHGEGLRPFDDAASALVGDVLIGTDRSVWIVASTDAKGHITGMSGAPRRPRPGAIALTWRPSRAERVWLQPGQQAAPGYRDLSQAMRHIVRLWGTANGERGIAATQLLIDILAAPGTAVMPGDLDAFFDDAELVAFCEKRGGMSKYSAGAVTAGDVLRLAGPARWAIVTRASRPDAAPVDLLVPGFRPGTVAEPRQTRQVVRGYVPTSADQFWRPAQPSSRARRRR